MNEVYKIQINDSEPIEVSQQVYEVSFCFNEMLKEKDKEIERLRKDIESFKKYVRIVNTIELHCLNSIYAINDILKTEKFIKFSKNDILKTEKFIKFSKNGRCLNRNKYQIERLRAYRTKSKEILKLIRRLENTYYGKEVK